MDVSLLGAIVERGHLLFGLVFLALVIDEARRRLVSRSAVATGRITQIAFLAAGVAMWIATLRADIVSDFVIHSLWADALLLIGGVEWAWQAGVVMARRWLLARPTAIAISGLLLLVHVHGAAGSPAVRAHLLMGAALVMAGLAGAAVHLAGGGRRRWTLSAQVPIVLFVALLITYPQ